MSSKKKSSSNITLAKLMAIGSALLALPDAETPPIAPGQSDPPIQGFRQSLWFRVGLRV